MNSTTAKQALPATASVVIIGGGIMGCSTAYHLAKRGVKDVVLLERKQLTCGTTWHSAAQVRQLRSTRNLTQLIKDSVALYGGLEAETGQSTGWVQTGSLSIATNPDRLIHIRRQAALARLYDVPVQELSAAEVKDFWPLAHTDDVIGAIYSPSDGRVNPSDLCAALVKSARTMGVQVFEDTPVTGFTKAGAQITGVDTAYGHIACESAVICGGLWSGEVAGLAGVTIPIQACEHFYLLTKPVEGITGRLPTLSDHDGHLYIRDDVGGLLVGCFEPMGKAIRLEDLPKDFAFDLLGEDWDHFEPMMLTGLHRIPALETAEVRMLLNGPESFTPDGSFLLGPAPEVDGLYLGCGMNSVGVATGGGAGKALAAWIAEGEAPMDLDEVHPARFHPSEAQLDAILARAPEVLGEHYAIAYPGREHKTARNLHRTATHDALVRAGARFGQRFGWERPLYFDPMNSVDQSLTFGKPGWFDVVGEECRAAHEAVALFEQSSFGKIEVKGPDAEAFLQRVCANNMSRAPGRAIYTAMLNNKGGIESDLTALRNSSDDYLLMPSTNRIRRDLAWLRRARRADEDLTFTDVTGDLSILGVMGPKSRELLHSLSAADLSDAAFPFFSHKTVSIAGIDVRAVRLSYVGELGWELIVPNCAATALFDALMQAGSRHGVRPAGAYAQTALRIEKQFLAIGHDIGPDTTPLDAGLGFALKLDDGPDFTGRSALLAQRQAGPKTRLVTVIPQEKNIWPIGHEPLLCDGRYIGQVTSAAFGYRIQRPVALAYVPSEFAREGRKLQIDIAGSFHPATLSLQAAFDPEGHRMKFGAPTVVSRLG
ncbi:GcvT family protein [Denitrobaculum tricleocarpae]|uniref:FAD-dependent oxidoreductase n=1 Tax=Denitrobaculum tricleocarpae TaxID=2591009 RepID=A0A545TYG6_9PROT|nr:FAD-dependent oxidoreductase [Denitrobaculum tricleocarpae]TQV82265.1 FAD-dependent oxidoreductase [Denitrobaculum tricleocarpae]